MVLEEGDPVLAVLDDRPGDLQRRACRRPPATTLADWSALGSSAAMPISVIVGIVPMAGWMSSSKSSLSNSAQLTGHLEPQGIDPDVGDLALAELRLHLLLEESSLPQQALDRVLGLGELGDEVLGQFASRLRCSAARPW